MDLLPLVNKAHSAWRRSERKQGAQKVGCVNHAMVEQLTNSTMESQPPPSCLCFTLGWSSDCWMAPIHLLQIRVLQLFGSLHYCNCVVKYCGYPAVVVTGSCGRQAVLEKRWRSVMHMKNKTGPTDVYASAGAGLYTRAAVLLLQRR